MVATLLALIFALVLPSYDTDGPGFSATVSSVYDGDTYTVLVAADPISGELTPTKIRLYDIENEQGINTPEVKGPEKIMGLASKFFVQEEFARSSEIRVITRGDTGKYGRLLADIAYRVKFLGDSSQWHYISHELLKKGLAETRDY